MNYFEANKELSELKENFIKSTKQTPLDIYLLDACTFLEGLDNYRGIHVKTDALIDYLEKLVKDTALLKITDYEAHRSLKYFSMQELSNQRAIEFFYERYPISNKESNNLTIGVIKSVKNLYVQLALTYRLSLKTMSEILKKTEVETYNYLMSFLDARVPLTFLFYYEIVNEDEKMRLWKKQLAKRFLLNYKIACKKGTDDKNQLLKSELLAIDEQFNQVKQKALRQERLTLEDYQIVSRYRLKYAISTNIMSRELGMYISKVSERERKYTDEELRGQIQELNDFLSASSHIKNSDGYRRF